MIFHAIATETINASSGCWAKKTINAPNPKSIMTQQYQKSA